GDQAGRVGQRPAVLPRGDVGQDLAPDSREPGQVLGGDRFLEPAHPGLGHPARDPHRLADPVAAVGVHVELGARPDDLAGQGHALEVAVLAGAPALADLDLHARDVVLLDPAGQLLAGLTVVITGETAAPVDRHAVVGLTEQLGQRAAEQ